MLGVIIMDTLRKHIHSCEIFACGGIPRALHFQNTFCNMGSFSSFLGRKIYFKCKC